MPSSKGGRSYSDPSYGSVKTLTFGVVAAGTRATAIVDGFTAMNPITILDWSMSNSTLGTGGSSQWVLAATSSNGTAALGTIIFVGTHAAGAVVSGTATETTIPTGGALHLYSVLSTAAALTVSAVVTYREAFVATDN
jgi:hypothetical protein